MIRSASVSSSLALLASLVLASGAAASTTIGDTTSTPDAFFGAGVVVVPDGVAVAQAGIVTSVAIRAHASGAGAVPFRVLVLRPTGTATYSVVAASDVTVGDTAGGFVRYEVPARVAVQPGDVPAVYVPPGNDDAIGARASGHAASGAAPGPPAVGSSVSTPDAGAAVPAVSAVVERDDDGDGYGDDSQDACPGLTVRHALPCAGDLVAGLSAAPSTISAGDVTTLTGTIAGSGAGAVAQLTLSGGLTPLTVSSTAGDCTGGGPYVCPLGDLAPGATQRVYAVVRGTAVGAQAATLSLSADTSEQQPADNVASTAVAVLAPALPSPPPKTVTAAALCRVPALRGRTLAGAKRLLRHARCAPGTVRHAKVKRGRVVSQRIPAGVHVRTGTKVGFTMRTRRRH